MSVRRKGGERHRPLLRFGRESSGGPNAAAIKELRLMGFSNHEAEVYVSLLAKSPATGYEISRVAGLPAANVYATLEALDKRGTVQLVAGRPKRYVPVPPETVTERIRSRLDANVGRLLNVLESTEKPAHLDYMWHIEGKGDLDSRIATLIRSATSHVGIRGLDAVIKSFEGDLRHAASKGASVIMVVFGTIDLGFGHVFTHNLQGMTPIGDVENTIVVTVDHERALVASLVGNVGAETRNQAFVSVVNTVIRHDVYLSEIFRRLGPVVDRTFGPALLSLRRILLPHSVIAELQNKLAKTGRLDRTGPPSRRRSAAD